MAYHTREIEKGIYGEISKVIEEFEELSDNNNSKMLFLCELSDYYGALNGFIINHNILDTDDIDKFNIEDGITNNLNYYISIFNNLHKRLILYSDDKDITDRQWFKLIEGIHKTINNIAICYNMSIFDIKYFSELTSSAFIEGKRK